MAATGNEAVTLKQLKMLNDNGQFVNVDIRFINAGITAYYLGENGLSNTSSDGIIKVKTGSPIIVGHSSRLKVSVSNGFAVVADASDQASYDYRSVENYEYAIFPLTDSDVTIGDMTGGGIIG